MKTAVKTPTRAVTAKATAGMGDVSPKFCEIRGEKMLNEKLMVKKCTNREQATKRKEETETNLTAITTARLQ